ncbi:hypothetical protein C8R46DRAFT_1194673 [Mycena filopes]|nr:hypothetical protein C8R46DRAFT_1194673 [Mycena filopes]
MLFALALLASLVGSTLAAPLDGELMARREVDGVSNYARHLAGTSATNIAREDAFELVARAHTKGATTKAAVAAAPGAKKAAKQAKAAAKAAAAAAAAGTVAVAPPAVVDPAATVAAPVADPAAVATTATGGKAAKKAAKQAAKQAKAAAKAAAAAAAVAAGTVAAAPAAVDPTAVGPVADPAQPQAQFPGEVENTQERQERGFGVVLANYFYFGTILLASASWLVAFVAQIVVTKIVGRSAVGVMWFAIFLQLFLIVWILLVLIRSDARVFRLQICAFGTMGVVFAVFGVDMSIFATDPARRAMAAGWLVLAVVDILWVLCFSAEPGTPVARLVAGMEVARRKSEEPSVDVGRDGARHISSPRARVGSVQARETKLSQSSARADVRSEGSVGDETRIGQSQRRPRNSSNGGSNSTSSPEISGAWTGMGRQRIVDQAQRGTPTTAQEELDEVLEPAPEEDLATPQTHSFPPASTSTSKNRRAVYLQEPRQLSTIYTAEGATSENGDSVADSGYPFKVRARSDWIPRSPSEISFKQGDVLYSAEQDGRKWWKVRKADGAVGSAPSNYFKVLGS